MVTLIPVFMADTTQQSAGSHMVPCLAWPASGAREQRIIYEDRMFAADEEGQGAGHLTPIICPLENKCVAAHFLF